MPSLDFMTIHKVFYYCQSFHFLTKKSVKSFNDSTIYFVVPFYSKIILIHEELSARIVIFWYNEEY